MDSLGFWALRLDVAVGKLSEVVEIIENYCLCLDVALNLL